jgi:hypothetical protein
VLGFTPTLGQSRVVTMKLAVRERKDKKKDFGFVPFLHASSLTYY